MIRLYATNFSIVFLHLLQRKMIELDIKVESPYLSRPNFQLGHLVTRAYNQVNDPIFSMETEEHFSLTTENIPTNLRKCRKCDKNSLIMIELRRLYESSDQTLVEVQEDNDCLKEEVMYLAKWKNKTMMRSIGIQTEKTETKLPMPIRVTKNKWFKKRFVRFILILCN